MYNEFMKDLNNPEGYIERRQRDFLRRYEEHKKELLYKQQMQKMPSIMASFNLCALRRTFLIAKSTYDVIAVRKINLRLMVLY